jgi:hypothetical protein
MNMFCSKEKPNQSNYFNSNERFEYFSFPFLNENAKKSQDCDSNCSKWTNFFVNKRKTEPCLKCKCDYCVQNLKPNEQGIFEQTKQSIATKKRMRSKSLSSLPNQVDPKRSLTHNSCSNIDLIIDLYRSELFKVRALERQIEKFDEKYKQLESKLEKEVLQQIRISFEWRKTCMNLIDENRRLRLQLYALTKSNNNELIDNLE